VISIVYSTQAQERGRPRRTRGVDVCLFVYLFPRVFLPRDVEDAERTESDQDDVGSWRSSAHADAQLNAFNATEPTGLRGSSTLHFDLLFSTQFHPNLLPHNPLPPPPPSHHSNPKPAGTASIDRANMSTTAGKPQAPGAVTPKQKIELFSSTYFGACTLGGIIGTITLHPI